MSLLCESLEHEMRDEANRIHDRFRALATEND